MRKILFFLLLSTAMAAAKPHSNIGPQGEWVSNGRWLMKVESVKTASNLEQFKALNWTKGIASPKGQKYTDQVNRLVFFKKGSVLQLEVAFKNSTKGAQKIGYDTPPWYVRCDDGQEVHNSGAVSNGAIPFLQEHLPRLGPVKPGGTLRGRMLFVLPADRQPNLLFFKAPPSIEKIAGKSETLVSRLGATKSSSVSPLKPNRAKSAWKSNQLWKMRLTDYRLVGTILDYKALPWTDRLKGEKREKHFSYVERNVFRKGGKVALVTLECKNLGDKKVPIGYELPAWRLHGPDSTLRLNGIYQQRIGWAIAGGMPKKTLLNAKAMAGGTFGFFLPKNFSPQHLDFEVYGKQSRVYGPTGSLKFDF